MRKVIGAAAILLGCFWAAWGRVRAKRAQNALLLSVRDALCELRRELAERQSDMAGIFRKLANKNRERATGALFRRLCMSMDTLGDRSFSEIWRAAVADELGDLGAEALETLGALGESLGGSELALQCEALERAARETEALAQQVKEALPEEKRMSFGLSLAAGALLVIMLI